MFPSNDTPSTSASSSRHRINIPIRLDPSLIPNYRQILSPSQPPTPYILPLSERSPSLQSTSQNNRQPPSTDNLPSSSTGNINTLRFIKAERRAKLAEIQRPSIINLEREKFQSHSIFDRSRFSSGTSGTTSRSRRPASLFSQGIGPISTLVPNINQSYILHSPSSSSLTPTPINNNRSSWSDPHIRAIPSRRCSLPSFPPSLPYPETPTFADTKIDAMSFLLPSTNLLSCTLEVWYDNDGRVDMYSSPNTG